MVCYEQSAAWWQAATRWLLFSVLLLNAVQESYSAPALESGAPTLPDKRSRMQYNFGLGKRDPTGPEFDQFPMLSSMVSDRSYPVYLVPISSSDDYYDQLIAAAGTDKRSRPQRFSFGLGKRSKEQMLLEEDAASQEDNADLEQLVKRKMKSYAFGLGKRTPAGPVPANANRKMKKLTNFEDYIKRRYSFGLGKRSV